MLALAWRWEWVGALGFIALAVVYVLRLYHPSWWTVYLMIPGPLLLIGLLFLAGWIRKTRTT